VTLLQKELPILDALVWTVAALVGVDHDAGASPVVPRPEELEPWEAHLPGGEPPFPFWRNFDVHPVAPEPSEWAKRRKRDG
jgi:hypothetical protein